MRKSIARTGEWPTRLAQFPPLAGNETLSYIESHKTFMRWVRVLRSLGLFWARRAICHGLITDNVLSL